MYRLRESRRVLARNHNMKETEKAPRMRAVICCMMSMGLSLIHISHPKREERV